MGDYPVVREELDFVRPCLQRPLKGMWPVAELLGGTRVEGGLGILGPGYGAVSRHQPAEQPMRRSCAQLWEH